MGRMWTHFPTQLRVGIVTKEAIASPKQCHGAICHSTDPVIRAPLKCPYTDTLLGIFFHTKYGVMALMHDYVRQANFASKPLVTKNSSPYYSLCVDILFNSGALGIYVRKLRNQQFQNKAWW